MFLLVTGASCVGKSTVRAAVQDALGGEVECLELTDLTAMPAEPDVTWRCRAVEAVVRHALTLQGSGRHVLLCGDPVPPGELLAAPAADGLDGIAVCLLDVEPEAHRQRLAGRSEPEAMWVRHLAFADWMRRHARDPGHMRHVIAAEGRCWDRMRWSRWTGWRAGDHRWSFAEVDTTGLAPSEVADRVLDWCRRALAGDGVAVLRGRWWEMGDT